MIFGSEQGYVGQTGDNGSLTYTCTITCIIATSITPSVADRYSPSFVLYITELTSPSLVFCSLTALPLPEAHLYMYISVCRFRVRQLSFATAWSSFFCMNYYSAVSYRLCAMWFRLAGTRKSRCWLNKPQRRQQLLRMRNQHKRQRPNHVCCRKLWCYIKALYRCLSFSTAD